MYDFSYQQRAFCLEFTFKYIGEIVSVYTQSDSKNHHRTEHYYLELLDEV